MTTTQLFTNNAIALLAESIGPMDMALTVQTGLGALFPQPVNPGDFFLVTLEPVNPPISPREILYITGRSGDVFTIEYRGWEGTSVGDAQPGTGLSWPANTTVVDHRVTAGTMAAAMVQGGGGGGSGSVTSVSASGGTTGLSFSGGPITTSGTLTLYGTLAPTSGGTGSNTAPVNGQLLIGSAGSYSVANLTAGSGISITNGAGSITISSTGGGGGSGVASIDLNDTSSVPIYTTTPTTASTGSVGLTISLKTQASGKVLAGPVSGSAAQPTFRSLTPSDLPGIYYLYQNGTPGTSFTVTHNLGQKYCNVTVVDNTDELIIPQSIKFVDENNLTVTFTSAIACTVIVMGVA